MNDRILPNQESAWPTGNLYTRVPALFRIHSSVAGWLLASCFIHGVVIILASMIIKQTDNLRRQDLIPINLVDVSWNEETRPIRVETLPEIKLPLPRPKVEKAKEPKWLARSEIVQPKQTPPAPAVPKEEPVKPVETKPDLTLKSEASPGFAPRPGSKAVAAKPVPAISLAKEMWRLCRDSERPVAAEATRLPVWEEDRVIPAFRLSRRR